TWTTRPYARIVSNCSTKSVRRLAPLGIFRRSKASARFGRAPTDRVCRQGNYCRRLVVSFGCQPIEELIMVIGIAHLQPIIALIAGILILVIPRLLNIIVSVYLIAAGLLGLGLFK